MILTRMKAMRMPLGISLVVLANLGLVLSAGRITRGSRTSNHVVNGNDAAPHAWPHQGAIKRTAGASHVCGCLYLNENFALTAAHCVWGGQAPDYYVLFGTNMREGTDGEPEIRELSGITMHEDFTNQCDVNGNCFNHDIALLVFAEALPVKEGFIEPIPLDAGAVDRYDQECFITGWGFLTGDGQLPEWLQEAHFSVITAEECESRLGASATYWNPTYQQCCFDNTGQNPAGIAGPCYGDSGGPVQCRASVTSPWELVGLANWMIGDCMSEYPSAWTNIGYYRPWICDKTGDNSLCEL